MGAGGQRSQGAAPKNALTACERARVPSDRPPFTLGDLRKAIPAHCWKRDTLKSFSYLLVDVLICSALAYAATWIDHSAVPRPLAWLVLWPMYWFWQVSPSEVCRGERVCCPDTPNVGKRYLCSARSPGLSSAPSVSCQQRDTCFASMSPAAGAGSCCAHWATAC